MDDSTRKTKTPPQVTSFDVEAFSRNLARLIEQGGKALAAYLKPREEGKLKDDLAQEISEIASTLGQVADYWLSDPQRMLELLAVVQENDRSVTLRFAAGRAIRLEIGRLACHLGDVGEPWATPWKPAHPVE